MPIINLPELQQKLERALPAFRSADPIDNSKILDTCGATKQAAIGVQVDLMHNGDRPEIRAKASETILRMHGMLSENNREGSVIQLVLSDNVNIANILNPVRNLENATS